MTERLKALQTRWDALSERERQLAAFAGTLVLVYLLWAMTIQPAWKTLREAPSQRAQAQALLDQLQAMAVQAQALQASAGAQGATQEPPRTMEAGVDDATRALLRGALGDSVRLDVQGRAVTVHFDGVSGEQVRQALQLLRSRLRAQLVDAELAPGEGGIRGRLRFEWIVG